MEVLELTRVYRSTQRILEFLSLAMTEWQKRSSNNVSVSLGLETSGHELLGQEVECLLLPKCSCYLFSLCRIQHLLADHWTVLLHLLKRLRDQVVEAGHITVMLDTDKNTADCLAWLERKLETLPRLKEVRLTNLGCVFLTHRPSIL